MTALCIVLFAAGHLVRDGWPPWRPLVLTWPPLLQRIFNPTQLARVSGAVLCGAGAWAVHPPLASLWLALAVLAGFYGDMKHGDGQSATGWRDAGFLALSGVTSLGPLAAVEWWLSGDPHRVLILLVGLTKIPIWFGWWAIEGHHGERRMTGFWPWLQPTRLSAIAFGAAIGAMVAL